MNNAIELAGVTWKADKSFKLDDVSLNVPAGSIYGFLGPNGSGKTTTIRMFMGMMKPNRGSIRVLGRDVPKDMKSILGRVGYVPERPHIYPSLTVGEQLKYHASFYQKWDEGWCNELLGRLYLDRGQKISRMSKGETGKLLLLMALSQRPELLVLDEPTDGLDPVVRRDVLTAVLDYVSEVSATVFISSHLVHELERICDWVGVMDHGKLIAELPMQHFKNGIKRLRVDHAPELAEVTPFTLLGRERANGLGSVETWIVRGWEPPMQEYFTGVGATVRDVIDLDLEEGFVELLRSSRPNHSDRSSAMYQPMLFLHWKQIKFGLLPFILGAFALPLLSVQGLGSPPGMETSSLDAYRIVSEGAMWLPFYPLLAAGIGALLALSAWNWDHQLKHVYALSLPVSRLEYSMLKMGAGAVLAMLPVAGLWIGAHVATLSVDLPQGLHAYPNQLAIRFGLATLVAYAALFAMSAGTIKTTVYILSGFATLLIAGNLATDLLANYFVTFESITLLEWVTRLTLEAPGPFEVFTGSWTLIDV